VAFPKQREIEVPLLAALEQLGGEARPRDVYPLVTRNFPDLTLEEQELRLESTPSTRPRLRTRPMGRFLSRQTLETCRTQT
jgi:restriction system protein